MEAELIDIVRRNRPLDGVGEQDAALIAFGREAVRRPQRQRGNLRARRARLRRAGPGGYRRADGRARGGRGGAGGLRPAVARGRRAPAPGAVAARGRRVACAVRTEFREHVMRIITVLPLCLVLSLALPAAQGEPDGDAGHLPHRRRGRRGDALRQPRGRVAARRRRVARPRVPRRRPHRRRGAGGGRDADRLPARHPLPHRPHGRRPAVGRAAADPPLHRPRRDGRHRGAPAGGVRTPIRRCAARARTARWRPATRCRWPAWTS